MAETVDENKIDWDNVDPSLSTLTLFKAVADDLSRVALKFEDADALEEQRAEKQSAVTKKDSQEKPRPLQAARLRK